MINTLSFSWFYCKMALNWSVAQSRLTVGFLRDGAQQYYNMITCYCNSWGSAGCVFSNKLDRYGCRPWVAKALASSILGMCLPWSQNCSIRFHRIGNTPATSNSILALKDLLPAEILKLHILLGLSSARLTYKHTAYYFYLKVLQKRCRPPTDLPAHPSTSCWFEVRTS
jgi:hypothetical protein